MKKIGCYFAILLIMAVSAMAGTKIVINPYNTQMMSTDQKNVDVCITQTLKGVTKNVVGMPITVDVAANGGVFTVTKVSEDAALTGVLALSVT